MQCLCIFFADGLKFIRRRGMMRSCEELPAVSSGGEF